MIINLINNNIKRTIYSPFFINNYVKSADLDEDVSAYNVLTLNLNNVLDIDIVELKSIIEVIDEKQNNKLIFIGRVIRKESNMDNSGVHSIFVEVEDFLSCFNDVVIRSIKMENTTLFSIVNQICYLNNLYNKYKFYCGDIDTITGLSIDESYENTYKVFQNFIKDNGFEFSINYVSDSNIKINVKKNIGSNKGYAVRIANNLLNLKSINDSRELITRIIPTIELGNEEGILTISRINGGKDYIANPELENYLGYSIEASMRNTDILNDYEDRNNLNLDEVANKLKNWGLSELNKKIMGDFSINLKFLDLNFLGNTKISSIDIGDTINVYNPLLNLSIDMRVISKKTDLFNPYNPDIELNSRSKKLTSEILDLKNPTISNRRVLTVNTISEVENITSTVPINESFVINNIKYIKSAYLYLTLDKYTVFNQDSVILTTYPTSLNIFVNNTLIKNIPGGVDNGINIINILDNLVNGNNNIKITSNTNGRVKLKIELTTAM